MSLVTSLSQILEKYDLFQLRDLGSLVTDTTPPKRKEELIPLIAHQVTTQLESFWLELDPIQQNAVAEVVYHDNSYWNVNQFVARYGAEPQWFERALGPSGYYSEPTKLLLFFYQDRQGLFIPDELKQRLQKFVPEPEPLTLDKLEQLPSVWRRSLKSRGIFISSQGVKKDEEKWEEIPLTIKHREATAIHDLFTILRLISSGKVTVSAKTQYPNQASLKAIDSLLAEGDYYKAPEIGNIQSFAWCLLLQAAGLVEGTKLQLTSAGQNALNTPPQQVIRQIWQKWLKTKIIDELKRINQIKGQTGKAGRSLTATHKRRQGILKAIKDCPIGKWIDIREFSHYIQAVGYEFSIRLTTDSFSLENSSFIEIGLSQKFSDSSSSYYWEALEGRYLLCFLFEYMATLGLLDVAYVHPGKAKVGWSKIFEERFFSSYDGLIYFRLNALGAYCLGLTKEYTPPVVEVSSEAKVLPNLEIVVTGEVLSASEQLMLDLYTEKISDSVWKLTEKQLLNAHSEGHKLSEFEAFLLKLSSNSLPKTVRQLLADVTAKANSLTKRGTGIIIDCADTALANLIAHDSRTKKYCILAGKKSLVVPLELETKFRNGLQKLGYSLPSN
ncbi:MAG: helicase-associated domain-containing protein [Xenococcaceae cyanobacterium MO_234.B1]|nr:helicase-associated domain-containing protein [Xenococcaceae cyanobacterium MO_234.B1]